MNGPLHVTLAQSYPLLAFCRCLFIYVAVTVATVICVSFVRSSAATTETPDCALKQAVYFCSLLMMMNMSKAFSVRRWDSVLGCKIGVAYLKYE